MNALDYILLAFVAIGFLMGLFHGFFREAVGTAGLLLAAVAANWLAPYTVPTFGQWIDNQTAAAIVVWVVVFVVAMLAMRGVAYLLSRLATAITLGWLNRLAGGVLGGLKYAFIAALVVALVQALGGLAEELPLAEYIDGSTVVPVLQDVVAAVMPWLNEHVIEPAMEML